MIAVSSPKELWAGLIYLAFGVAGWAIGSDYPVGTAGRMGSGYFPKVLATILVGFGLVSIVRGFVRSGGSVTRLHLKPLFLILAACSLFGLLLEPLGLPVALLVLILLSALASREFKLRVRPVLGAVGLTALCTVVFVMGLGVPMPLIGTWLEPPAAYFGWRR